MRITSSKWRCSKRMINGISFRNYAIDFKNRSKWHFRRQQLREAKFDPLWCLAKMSGSSVEHRRNSDCIGIVLLIKLKLESPKRLSLWKSASIYSYQITSFSISPSCLEYSPILDLILELADGFVYLKMIDARIKEVHLNKPMPVWGI